MKSNFIAHAAPYYSRDETLSHITTLISTSKKLATATHNITAYRIWQAGCSSFMRDCDEGGESATGGRLLYLLQLMERENVVFVITRWDGGVELGGKRFKCIRNVARAVLVKGGQQRSSLCVCLPRDGDCRWGVQKFRLDLT
jgi:putative IMPACT (imprinted ancient) family translation regulator